jgi:hypothetical protein
MFPKAAGNQGTGSRKRLAMAMSIRERHRAIRCVGSAASRCAAHPCG